MAVERVRDGERPSSVIASFGFNRATIYRWLKAASKPGVGLSALRSRPATGRPRSLTPRQEQQVFRWINGCDPRQYGLDFGLWTRSLVAALIERKFHIRLGVTAVGELLAKLGVTPQKPLQRAYQRDPAAIEKWQREQFPAIARQAKASGGEVYFWDESGFRADAVHGKTWGRKGQTPVVERPGQRRVLWRPAIQNQAAVASLAARCDAVRALDRETAEFAVAQPFDQLKSRSMISLPCCDTSRRLMGGGTTVAEPASIPSTASFYPESAGPKSAWPSTTVSPTEFRRVGNYYLCYENIGYAEATGASEVCGRRDDGPPHQHFHPSWCPHPGRGTAVSSKGSGLMAALSTFTTSHSARARATIQRTAASCIREAHKAVRVP